LVGYGAPAQIDTTIAEIRSGGVCGPVRIENAVAVARSIGEDDGETTVFVQDEGGGDYSGIVVFMPSSYLAIEAGDLVTAIGSVSDYYGLAEIYVGTENSGIGVVEDGGGPVASVLAEVPSDWEPYESTLVTLQGVTSVSDEEYGAVYTDWGVYVDNLLYNHDGENGTVWTSVTGALYYTSYDDIPTWNVEPRDANDLQ
jgi:hypothetical protein